MDLSIILVNYNVFEDIKLCVQNIYTHLSGIRFEIIVVDNCSMDREVEKINEFFPLVKPVFLDNNYGFGYANNVGMKSASGKYFLLINPDIIINDGSIQLIYSTLENNLRAAVAGPIQYKPGEGLEYYYTFFPSLYSRFMQEFGLYMKSKLMKKRFFEFLDENIKKEVPFKVDWVIGSCMMLRKEIFFETGGFDEAFFLFEEETEWQYRIKELGYDVLMIPQAKVVHNHHSSTSKIGVMFILFQEYRSRIIFDLKRNDLLFSFSRRLMIACSVIFRFTIFNLVNFSSFEILKKRIYLYWDLLKLNLSTKDRIMKDRFVFSKYAEYFSNTGNAKI